MMGYLDSDFDGMTLTAGGCRGCLHGVNIPPMAYPPISRHRQGERWTAGKGRRERERGAGSRRRLTPSEPSAGRQRNFGDFEKSC